MLDKIDIVVQAGRGGDGIASFRREKFVPFGGPDGGDGGAGGDVIIKADSSFTGLGIFRRKKAYRATAGGGGRGRKKHGRKGEDLVLLVPVGTVVSNRMQLSDDAGIADLAQPEQWVVVVKGGKGGLGNTHFTSSTNQAPQIAQKGEAGEVREIILELRIIADVGIIGYPNVGKSSLLAAASAARPKIAGYPFTTLEPMLGVVEVDQQSFVLAEIPGLVADAHLGRGLGHDFLRHALRTKILIHLLDGSSTSPVEDMIRVNNELSLFDSALAQKRQLVVVNKVDLPGVQARIAELRSSFSSIGVAACFVSAATGEGVSRLMAEASAVLVKITAGEVAARKATRRVFRPRPKSGGIGVHREGDTLIIESSALERVVAGTELTDPEARRQLISYLARPGVSRALLKAGVKPGDKVRCDNLEWEW